MGEPGELAESTPAAVPRKSHGCLWAVGGFVILWLAIGASCAIMANSGSGDSWSPTSTEARSICEGWVRDRLKAPSTAQFQDGTTSGSDGSYTIAGSVDAQNSFGAMIRTDWTCTIEYRDSDQKWHGSASLDQ